MFEVRTPTFTPSTWGKRDHRYCLGEGKALIRAVDKKPPNKKAKTADGKAATADSKASAAEEKTT